MNVLPEGTIEVHRHLRVLLFETIPEIKSSGNNWLYDSQRDVCCISSISIGWRRLQNILRRDRGFGKIVLFKMEIKMVNCIEKKNVHLTNFLIRI